MLPLVKEEAVSRLERQTGGFIRHAPNIQLQVADVAVCHHIRLLLTGSFLLHLAYEIMRTPYEKKLTNTAYSITSCYRWLALYFVSIN